MDRYPEKKTQTNRIFSIGAKTCKCMYYIPTSAGNYEHSLNLVPKLTGPYATKADIQAVKKHVRLNC